MNLKQLSCLLIAAAPTFATLAQKPGINLSYIDSSADPRNDFYTFCNGKWQKTFVLPASDARYGSFNEIHENNLKKLKVIYDNTAKNKSAAPNSNTQKLRDFYVTAMDSARANALGTKPIEAQMKEIDNVKDLAGFYQLKSKFEFNGIDLLFSSGVSPDLKNSRRNLFGVYQGGYGLGDRDYYHSDKHDKIRSAYKEYLTQLFEAAGTKKDVATANADKVFAFEKKLTEAAMTRVEMRDPEKQYNPMGKDAFGKISPQFGWNEYFSIKGIAQPDTVNVGMPKYMTGVSELLASTPLEDLKTYARARLLMESAPYLSSKFVDINFNFRGRVMSGATQMKPRWQRVHNVVNGSMGEIISQEYVKKHFTPEAKAKLNQLIDNLIDSYRQRITTREWMGPETKMAAQRKLDQLIRKIGYPDNWKDYSQLKTGTDNYWANVCRANDFLTRDNLGELKKPVDRMKWQMTPVTVNAYYDPTTNEITFPAAILQPPFYDASADDAANYGTMGSIIGHELTHGFDDQGSQFDADGNMKMWWSEKDLQNFKERTHRIVSQFDAYVAIDTLHVSGSMTQGENIADLGGLTMSYYAYKRSLMNKPSPVIGGFTGEQRFFIAWAQGWKTVTRDAELKRLLTLDYHSPGYFRAFAPLTNMPEFHAAFGVKPGDKMYTPDDKKVEIW